MARRKPSWLRRSWWFNVRRHLEETKAWGSQLAVERLLQEGLLQFLQGGEFAFVEANEAEGFCMQAVDLLNNLNLPIKGWQIER